MMPVVTLEVSCRGGMMPSLNSCFSEKVCASAEITCQVVWKLGCRVVRGLWQQVLCE